MRDSMSRTVERFPPSYLLDEHLGACDPLFRKLVRIRQILMCLLIGVASGIAKLEIKLSGLHRAAFPDSTRENLDYHARPYCTGPGSASLWPNLRAAMRGQYGSRKNSRAKSTMSARPLRMISSAWVGSSTDGGSRPSSPLYQRLEQEALTVERRTIIQLRVEYVINDEVLRQIQRDLDLAEARLKLSQADV